MGVTGDSKEVVQGRLKNLESCKHIRNMILQEVKSLDWP